MIPTSHATLVARAVLWLERQKRCGFVLSEMHCNWIESPDAMGFTSKHSILIECKTSRSDFARDRKKASRRDGIGMGVFRFYLTPANLVKSYEFDTLISGEEAPVHGGRGLYKWGSSGWGLLWYHAESDSVRMIRPSQRFDVNLRAENLFLCSALRRVQLRLTQPLREYIRWTESPVVKAEARRSKCSIPVVPAS
jgi:hypothetical protein